MAEEKVPGQTSQDAAMARSLHQYREWQSQSESQSKQPQGSNVSQSETVASPPPGQNSQAQQTSERAISQGKTLKDGKWTEQNSAPASQQVQSAGESLHHSGVTTNASLSPERTQATQNTLDTASQSSSNQASQEDNASKLGSVRTEAKNAASPDSPEPSMQK